MPADLTYWRDSMFTRFLANTPAGEAAWDEMAKEDGVAAVFHHQEAATLRQLRAAGYTVAKEPKAAPMSPAELDALLSKLEG